MLQDDGWALVVTKGSHRQFNTRPSQAASPSAVNLATTCRKVRLRRSNARQGSEEKDREETTIPCAHQQRH
jgi:hypothetical protein